MLITPSIKKICSTRTAIRLTAIIAASVQAFAKCEAADEPSLVPLGTLSAYVQPIQLPSWSAPGIYLGRGLFITAAHAIGRTAVTRPRMIINGREFTTSVVKEGGLSSTDLTLLRITEQDSMPMRLRLRQMSLCKNLPKPGQQVVTVSLDGIARSQILAPDRLPPETRRYATAIADVKGTGNSGSGVFDAESRCLLGIVSRKISRSRIDPVTHKTDVQDIAKYFVPASEIELFVATGDAAHQ